MRGIIIVLMAILGVIFPKFLVKAIKSTDKNDAGGGLLGSQITFGMLMLILVYFSIRVFKAECFANPCKDNMP